MRVFKFFGAFVLSCALYIIGMHLLGIYIGHATGREMCAMACIYWAGVLMAAAGSGMAND